MKYIQYNINIPWYNQHKIDENWGTKDASIFFIIILVQLQITITPQTYPTAQTYTFEKTKFRRPVQKIYSKKPNILKYFILALC